MSTIITGFFQSHDQAMAAVADLKLHLVAGATDVIGAQRANEFESFVPAGLPRARVGAYAERVRQGGVAVVVRPVFGSAATAMEVLSLHQPALLESHYATTKMTTSSPSPLSDLLRLPTLSTKGTLLSSMVGLIMLTPRQTSNTRLMDSPSPLSNIVKMPLLSAGMTDKSFSLGMPLLTSNPTPLSSACGLPVLSDIR